LCLLTQRIYISLTMSKKNTAKTASKNSPSQRGPMSVVKMGGKIVIKVKVFFRGQDGKRHDYSAVAYKEEAAGSKSNLFVTGTDAHNHMYWSSLEADE